jgi:hypothetical protein
MKIVVALVCGAVIVFLALVFVVDRFILSPAPTTAPVRAK